jgi:hypothetical protein
MNRWLAGTVVLAACKGGHRAAAAEAAKIGETIVFDDSDWVVQGAKDEGKTLRSMSKLHADKTTAGRFVEVHYEVTNKGKTDAMLINPPRIVDAKKDSIEHIQTESFYLPPSHKSFALDTLAPHTKREFWTIFEVPAGATGIQCEVHALAAFGDKRAVDLGI